MEETRLVDEAYVKKEVLKNLKRKNGSCIKTLNGHNNWIYSVAFSPDGKYLASGSYDKTIKIWDIEIGSCIKTLNGHNNWIYSVAFSPDGKYLASGSSDKTIKIWDIEIGSCIKTLNGHNNYVCSVTFSPDGKYLASGSYDKTIKIWDIEIGSCIKTLNGHNNYVYSVTFSPDGKYLASGSYDKTIKIWDIEIGSCIKTLNGHNDWIFSVAFSPDGKYLASGSYDKTIKIWDIEIGSCIKTLNGHNDWIFSVAFSPDGKYLASGSYDKTIKIWDIEIGSCIKTLNGHNNYVYSVTFSPDGKYLASGSYDKTIKIWDISDIIKVADIKKFLLNEDKIRADLMPYNEKMLEDINEGHWSLWPDEWFEENEKYEKVKLSKPLVARNPKSSINNGVVGIDFGTKNTVVVYQKESADIHPMRIGIGDLSKKVEAHHYENPTIMEFNNLKSFLDEYFSQDGRPLTKWEDLTISHTAYNNLLNSKSDYFNAYLSELKQWAGDKDKKLKIVDKKGFVVDLPPFLETEEINPIEIYAYYLGLYINNMYNGIFLDYILSFPVIYEVEVREKILKSFYNGLKKSLPQQLQNQKDIIERLSVVAGASEPAAYAIVALEEYGFEPEGDEKVFYGVFDFGGGTTDFDFGIFREANGKKERRYDFVLEHFGAGGDRYLGGENLLELLAFEVFKDNKESLLEKRIQFIKHPEAKEFLGSEPLLSNSREAKMNTKQLMETLRPFWENSEDEEVQRRFEEGVLNVNLWDINGKMYTNFELSFDKEKMIKILRNRIDKGVKNFFHSLRLAFANHKELLDDVEEINIFLAGNSSKSPILKELFEKEIENQNKLFKKELNRDDIFKIFPPLENKDNFEKPNGKTGVAFGLIEARKGGRILVIDRDVKKESSQINFKYYLGYNKRKKFKVAIDRETPYNKWIEFIDAGEDTFEIFYSSSSIVTTNTVSITDESIKKISLKIDVVDENASVYIRLVSPDEIEYVVSDENKIVNGKYLGKIHKIRLK